MKMLIVLLIAASALLAEELKPTPKPPVPTVASLQIEVEKLKGQLKYAQAQFRYEQQACWEPGLMSAKYEAALARKELATIETKEAEKAAADEAAAKNAAKDKEKEKSK